MSQYIGLFEINLLEDAFDTKQTIINLSVENFTLVIEAIFKRRKNRKKEKISMLQSIWLDR